MELGSSVSLVSGYGLDDRAIGVRSPSEAKDFSFHLSFVRKNVTFSLLILSSVEFGGLESSVMKNS
jgi:hypothetical protein